MKILLVTHYFDYELMSGYIENINCLIYKGAKVNISVSNRQEILYCTIKATIKLVKEDTIKFLFDSKDINFDVNEIINSNCLDDDENKNKGGLLYCVVDLLTSTHSQCQTVCVNIIRYLITEKFADVNACNNNNRVPLHSVTEHCKNFDSNEKCLCIAQLLIENHANVNIKDNDGKTPLSYANKKWSISMIAILIQDNSEEKQTSFDDLDKLAKNQFITVDQLFNNEIEDNKKKNLDINADNDAEPDYGKINDAITELKEKYNEYKNKQQSVSGNINNATVQPQKLANI